MGQNSGLFSRLLRAIAKFVSESSKQMGVPVGGPAIDALLQYQSDEHLDRMEETLRGVAEGQKTFQQALDYIRRTLQVPDASEKELFGFAETLVATAALPHVAFIFSSQSALPSSEDILRRIVEYVPPPSSQDTIDDLLRKGLRRSHYADMLELRAAIEMENTGYKFELFPNGASDLRIGYTKFVRTFWGNDDLPRHRVLAVLVEDNPTILELREAFFSHAVYTWNLRYRVPSRTALLRNNT